MGRLTGRTGAPLRGPCLRHPVPDILGALGNIRFNFGFSPASAPELA